MVRCCHGAWPMRCNVPGRLAYHHSHGSPHTADYLVNVAAANPSCPNNVYLLCGDHRLGEAGRLLRASHLVFPSVQSPFIAAALCCWAKSLPGCWARLLGHAAAPTLVTFKVCAPHMMHSAFTCHADDLTQHIRDRLAKNPLMAMHDPYKATLSVLRELFKKLQEPGGRLAGKDIAVFIDTNPAFTEYTQLALCEWSGMLCLARGLKGKPLPRSVPGHTDS